MVELLYDTKEKKEREKVRKMRRGEVRRRNRGNQEETRNLKNRVGGEVRRSRSLESLKETSSYAHTTRQIQ